MATPIPQNEAAFTVDELVHATGATVVSRGAGVRGVCTDSRAVTKGCLFVALVGARFDGHDHAAAAVRAGAAAVLVSRDVEVPAGTTVLRVPDTTSALGALGRAHRVRWGSSGEQKRVVAITGSAGKTTTRRAVAAVLRGAGFSVHATTGNLNNAVGIPMVLLGLRAEHDYAVVEIGTSSPGEIAAGAAMALPDVGVLTLIAAAHTEGLGTVEDVAVEKGALLAALPETGAAIVNGDNALCALQLARSQASTSLRYGTGGGMDVHVAARRTDGIAGAHVTLVIASTGQRFEVRTPLLGVAGAYATAAAAAVLATERPSSLSADALSAALAELEGEELGRLSARALEDDVVLIDDSYNANRASTESSIEAAAEIARAAGARLVLVLGEMRELGALSVPEHAAVGRFAAAAHPALVVAVAGDAERFVDAPRAAGIEASFVPDAAAAAALVVPRVQRGDVVLVKGSRGVGLELVAAVIASRGSKAQG